jgi:hypothetical protein
VPTLIAITKNLTINLSADRDNWDTAYTVWDMWSKFVRLSYLSTGEVPENLPAGSVIFPDYPYRGRDLENPTSHSWWKDLSKEQRQMVCPADFFGQSEQHRCGPCKKCLLPPGQVSNDRPWGLSGHVLIMPEERKTV